MRAAIALAALLALADLQNVERSRRDLTASAHDCEITITRKDGTVVRELEAGGAIRNFGWLNDHQVWAEVHVNPSSNIYVVWDAGDGGKVTERRGSWFAPSPDGERLAYVEHVAHWAPHPPPRLFVDDHLVYTSRKDERITNLRWSPDGRRIHFTVTTASGTSLRKSAALPPGT